MSARLIVILASMFVLAPARLPAALVTYDFSGVWNQDTIFTPITNGTPFSGTVTFDTSAAGTPNGSLTDYPQAIPPTNLTLHVAGLTVQSTGDGLAQTAAFTTRAKFVYFAGTNSFTGLGWSYVPTASATSVQNLFGATYDISYGTDLANLPLLTTSVQYPANIQLILQPGNYTFPGGSTTIPDTDFVNYTVATSTLTLVPEPASLVMAALAVVGLLVSCRRCRSRL